jgi:hypothetical protein
MNTSMVKGMAIGGIAMVVLAAGGVTGYTTLTKPMVAEVVAVKEATEKVVTPREQCEDVQVQHQAPLQDKHRVAGTAIGAVAGGLLGSTVGGGSGKTLATVAVAAALLWEVSRHGLIWYFSTLSQIGAVYGSLTTAIAVLLSLEIAAALLLLGAQVISEYERVDAATGDAASEALPFTTQGA